LHNSFVNCLTEISCPLLDAPDNGTIECTLGEDGVARKGDKCTVKCDDGFKLHGSATRICIALRGRAIWSGWKAVCSEGVCISLSIRFNMSL